MDAFDSLIAKIYAEIKDIDSVALIDKGVDATDAQSFRQLEFDCAISRLESFRGQPVDFDLDHSDIHNTVSTRSLDLAQKILAMLPASLPLPISSVSEDGGICFEWRGTHCAAEMSISPNNELSFYKRFKTGAKQQTFIPNFLSSISAEGIHI